MNKIVDRTQVEGVYSGKPGCACGCRGNYSENPATITRIVNRINALGANWYEDDDTRAWAHNEDGTRIYIAYLTS